jgi:DNA-binding beta-propeller fold protein YncE
VNALEISRMKFLKRLALVTLLACSAWLTSQTSAEPLVERWSIKDTFNMPESAAFDSVGRQIFVSNVNHYAKDGNGFVSRVSADGTEVELKWLSDLNSPTGLTVNDGKLYVVDYDALIIASIADQKILSRITGPDERPALNDVAVSPSGDVFVTGSSSATIYRLEEDQLAVWKQDDKLLKHANGLLIDNDKLIYGGAKWWIFDLQSKDLVDDFKTPAPNIEEIDGITFDGCGGYIVSLIDDDRLWHVSAKGRAAVLADTPINGIDLEAHDGLLYVPTVGGGLSVVEIPPSACLNED